MSVRNARRVVFAAVLAAVVGAGQWLMLKADVPQVAAGTWASAGGFGPVPDGAASATLPDGRMVVAGGRYDNGTLVSQIGIFDPATQSWDDGGQLAMARTGHTASALSDGRVLFAGGYTANGLSSDVEIYDPRTGQSVHSGDMWSPRVNHAAASLGSVVFIAGGSDGSSVLDHVELFDADSGQTQSLAVRMSSPRKDFTATTLLDGHVLIAGGRNDSGLLATAEIFESGSRSIFLTGPLHAARSGHVAVLLPNNNQVLIAGGNGASAELYADWRDGFTVVPNAMTQPRTGALGGALPLHDLAFVGGGGSPTGEYFGYATVKTDRADYWPGETVTITGSGWQPGERVALKISEDADTHNDFNFTAVADAQGRIENKEFAPIENEVFHHFGMRFYLTATGVASTALNTFTDGNATITGVVRDSVTNLPLANVTISCTTGCNGNQNPTTTDVAGAYTLTVNFAGNGPAPLTLTASKAGYTNQTTPSFNVTQAGPNTKDFLLVPNATSTSTSISTSGTPSVYGDAVTFTATVTPTSATGSVQFKDGVVNLGGPVTVSGGQATLPTSALLAGAHSITAVFTGTAPFTDSTSSPLNQQVNAKALTITATNQNKVYGTVVTPAGTEFTVSGLVGTDNVTSVTLSSSGYVATASVAGSPHAITPSAAVGSGLTNYNIIYTAGTMTVSARPVTVSADAKTKVYGAADPALTYQLTVGSLVGGDAFSGSLSRASGESVAGSPYGIGQGTLTLGTNYAITFVGANLSITPATLTVAAQPQTKQYGASDPSLTYLAGGLQFSDTAATVLTGLLARAPGENVAGSPYAITQGSLVANSNYTIAFTASTLSITPAALTVTAEARTKPYGDADPSLTYLSSGFKFSDTAATVLTGLLVRAPGENVAGSPYAIAQGTLAANSNYTIAFTAANLSITPAPLTVTAEAKTKQYGDADPALTYTSDGFKLTDTAAAVLSGALARAPGETVAGGPYPIGQGSLAANANYALTFAGANLSITARPITVTADGKTKTYGDADPSLTYQVTTGSLVNSDTFSGSLTRLAGEDVASYAIQQGTLALSSNYALTFVGANLSITTRGITVTADAKTKTYGDADPSLTYQVTTGSLVNSDTFSGSLTRLAGEDVGSYAIQQGTLALNGNYALSFVGANLSITARAITVTADAKTKTYGGADPALTYQVTTGALVAGDSFSGSLTRLAGEDVGSYAIQQGTLALNGNYALSFVGANLSITARAITVTADGKTKTYGGTDPALTYQVTTGALVAGDSFSGSLTRVAGEDVGSYAIQQGTLALNDNYALSFVGANLSITARAITVTADPKTKTYGGADPAVTYQVTTGALVAGDSFSGSLTRVAGEDVGSYAIQQGSLALSGNYALTFVGANLSITAQAITVTADAKTKTYGDADPSLTYQVTTGSLVSGDAFSGNLTRLAGEDVGSYAIQQGTLALSSNYALSFVGANLSITARAITVTADSKTKTYGGADPALTYQVTTGVLVAGDSFSGSLSRVAGEDVGSYAIQQGTLALSGNYALTFVGANLSITKATPVITWSTPAAITYPAALSGAQLNASANVPGTFVYTPPTGTVLNAGPGQTLHVDFTPSDTTNYTTAVKNVLITVLKASQAITFAAPGPKTFGDPPVPVGATGGSSGQPVTFQTMTPAICSASPNGVNAATVTINAVGQCTVRASQAGTSNYEPAADVDRSFSVATWTAQGFHQPVGIPNSVFAPATTELLAGPPASAAWNSAKGGSTIPLKFNVFAAGVERTNTADIVGFSLQQLPACNGTSYEDPLDIETAGATVLRYDGVAGSGGQFIQNWKTPAVKAEQCYRVAVTLKDQSVLYTFVKLKK